jgi:hypothetical protein
MSDPARPNQRAYILIGVQPGTEAEVYAELKQISSITAIDLVRGPFDFIVVAEGNVSDLDKAAFRIRKTPYVRSTVTLMVWETLPWQEVSGQLDYGHV